jgi:uncharacterized membrane protein
MHNPSAPLHDNAYQQPRSFETQGLAMHQSSSPNMQRRQNGSDVLPMALGWFSVGLGLAELLMPKKVAHAAGVNSSSTLVRSLGVRELASGVGILRNRQQSAWLWSRVAGDVMDMALLGMAARSPEARRKRVAMALAVVAGVAVADVMASRRQQRSTTQISNGTVHFSKAISINKPVEEVYRSWRNFEGFPRFMAHLKEVQVIDDTRSHWIARGPGDRVVEWDAEIIEDVPNERLAWRSLENADIDNAGVVRFEKAPGGRGTIIRVETHYRPPGGAAGRIVAQLFGEEPQMQIDDDLRRFKQLMETGEITTTIGQPAGKRSAIGRLLRKGEPG